MALALSATQAHAGHLSGDLLVSGKLTGDQEVPSVTTSASGVASFFLNDTWDTLFVNINAANLSGDITGIHVHEGAKGSKGGVVTDLSSFVLGNQVKGYLTGSNLTSAMIAKYLSGAYYINLHTAAHPSGEIRAQLGLETDWAFRASLDTAQQGHAVSNNAQGLAYLNLSHDKSTLEVKVVADGLSGAITGAHLHYGAKGVDGGVAVDLSSIISGNTLMGDIDVSAVAGLADSLTAGSVYINLHTTANPAGEIRGQVWLEEKLAFDAWLDVNQQTTPPAGSTGVGAAYLSLNTTLDTLWYEAQVQGMSGAISAAHLHQAAVGSDGGVLLDLSPGISGNRIVGMATGAAITNQLVASLLKGEIYINTHTAANPAGEIRGQVYRLAREGYTFSLESNQEVPSLFATAKGGGMVSIDRNQTNAHYMIALDGLTAALTGAHFHAEKMGANGGVLYNLSSAFSAAGTDDAAYGYWKSSDATPFTTASSAAFRNDSVYVNIHTAQNAGGEIRGQLLRGAIEHKHQTVNNGTTAVDPMFAGKVLFSAKFTGDQEVPAVVTTATGVGGFALNDQMDTLWVNINLDGLSGPITGAHIHEAAMGANGNVVTDLSSMINEAQIKGFITSFDLQKFIEGAYYVNVHTAAHPSGEVRGQVLFESDWMFQADLTGGQEVPAVSTNAMGKGVFNLSQDESELTVKIVVNGLSGSITGAHLHQASAGANGGVVADLSSYIVDNYIVATLDPSSYLTALKNGEIYINVHTAANAAGEVRGQLNLAKAFTLDAWFSGAQMSPEAQSPAAGVGALWFSAAWDSLHYDIQLDHMSGPVTGIHIHDGAIGANGSVLVDLTGSVNGMRVKGSVTGTALTASLIQALVAGKTYINAHSVGFPNGEARGQVLRLAASGYSFDVCGAQEVPATSGSGYGGGILTVNRANKKAHLMFTTTGLSGAITGAHLHNEAKGSNGGVLTDLSGILNLNSGFQYLDIDSTFASEVKAGKVYLNVHTALEAGGEVRGQIDNVDDCPAPSITSNESVQNVNAMKVYPNPTSGQIQVQFEQELTDAILTIQDVFGNTVYIKRIIGTSQNEQVDLSDFAAGIYFVKTINDGTESIAKIIKN